MKTTKLITLAALSVLTFTSVRAADIAPEEVRAIAKEAYIYGFPLVDNYRVEYAYFVDRESPELQAARQPRDRHRHRAFEQDRNA